MPASHSASVNCTSRAKACRCRTRLVMISFSRGSGAASWRVSTASVMVCSSRLRMVVWWLGTKRSTVVDTLEERPDLDAFPDARSVERIVRIETPDCVDVVGFIEEKAADHRLLVLGKQRSRHDYLDRCRGEIGFMRFVVRQATFNHAVVIEAITSEMHESLQGDRVRQRSMIQ